MSTDLRDRELDDDLRTAFAALAATTTIAPDARFGDIAGRALPSSRRHWPVLVAAAACVALVVGLAVAARDRTPDAPAPADTTMVPVETPQFLFPEPGSDVRFVDPVAALDAYLADHMSTAPGGAIVTYEITTTTPPFEGGEDQPMLGFSLTLTPDDPALCCDSGDGVAYLQLVDGAWFVRSAEITAMRVTELSYSDDGVVSGAYAPMIGGTYTVTIDDHGWPGPDETGFVGEHEPDPDDPANGPTFRSPGHTAPAVAVRIWQSPSASTPYPAAMFAEFIVPRGTVNASNISIDDADAATTTSGGGPLPGGLSTSTWPTPTEAVEAYLSDRVTNGGTSAAYSVDPVVGRLGGGGQALVRFELGGTEGVANVYDFGVAGDPAWSVMIAGTTGLRFRDTIVDGDRVTAILTSAVDARLVVTAHDMVTGAEVGNITAEVGPAEAVVTVDIAGVSNEVSLRAWALDSAMFGEVPANGGWLSVEFDSFLAQYADVIDDGDAVPPLVGLTESQARATLDQLDLPANVTYVGVPAGDDRDGTVIEQGAVAGSSIVRGMAIEVTVAVATQ